MTPLEKLISDLRASGHPTLIEAADVLEGKKEATFGLGVAIIRMQFQGHPVRAILADDALAYIEADEEGDD